MRSLRSALTLALATLAACGGGDGSQGPGNGRTAVFLTDSPFPFDGVSRVDMFIEEIALGPAGDSSQVESSWVVVATPNRAFNLLDLQNGTPALLGDAVVPPGQYRAVRVAINFDQSSITTSDGRKLTGTSSPDGPGIFWPQTFARAQLFASVEEAMAIDQNGGDIVLDFDVGRSFDYYGNDRFAFVPWIRAITRTGSGAISGIARRADTGAPIPHAVVLLGVGDTLGWQRTPFATSRTDGDGRFKASFLRPGPYVLMVEDLTRGVTSAPRSTQVHAGQTADLGEITF